MSSEKKLDLIRDFLSSEFPGFAVDTHDEGDHYRYDLRKEDCHHVILVLKDFLEAFHPHEIEMRLTNYNVAMIADNLSDVPILITTSGCIVERGSFGSLFCTPN